MVAQTIDRFGKVDILVNNAGVAGTSPIPKITEELWDRNIAVNCFRPAAVSKPCQAGLPRRAWH